MVDRQARYLESHEWAKKQGGYVVVGLSDFAIEQLGDIVFMELPKVGTSVTKGQAFGVVESVKTAADIYAPVSGKVANVNSDAVDNPDSLKADAYGQGWLVKITADSAEEYDTLMDADAYEKFLQSRQD